MPQEHNPRWLSVAGLAEYLDVSKETVYKWLGKDLVPAHKVGKLWRFDVEEIDAWIKSGVASRTDESEAAGDK